MPHSADLDRIMSLPVRVPPSESELESLAWLMTKRLGRFNPNCQCADRGYPCHDTLRGGQAWALWEAPRAKGMFISSGVGTGKTGIAALMAMVMLQPGESAVLLIKADLKPQFLRDFDVWSEHFKTPALAGGKAHQLKVGRPVLHVLTYSELSNAKSVRLLESIPRLRLIIADESQLLANPTSARGNRFFKFLEQHPQCMFVAMTATPLNDSVKNFAHHMACALGEGSPYPLSANQVTQWAGHLDPSLKGDRAAAGALTVLPGGVEDRRVPGGVCARGAVEARASSTPGVMVLTTPSIGTPLLLTRHPLVMPPDVKATIDSIGKDWKRPDGVDLVDIQSLKRCQSEAAGGFYFYEVWHGTQDMRVVREWRAVRSMYYGEMRAQIQMGHPHLDSKLLAERAAARWHDGYKFGGRVYPPGTKWCGEDAPDDPAAREKWLERLRTRGPLQTWASDHLPEWRRVKDNCRPEQRVHWISEFLVEDAAQWAAQSPGIVWFRHRPFGTKLAKHMPVFGQGKEASATIGLEKGDRSIGASIKAHGTGKNLHMFSRALVVACPASGLDWEQLLGRLHRPRQTAPEVRFDICFHAPGLWNAFEQATAKAEFAEKMLKTPQRLCFAERRFALGM